MRRRMWLAAGAAALALTASACNSGPAESGASADAAASMTVTTGTTMTSTSDAASRPAGSADTASYVAQANAICLTMNDRSAELTEQVRTTPSTPADYATFLDEQADIVDQTVRALRSLPKPAGEETQIDGLLAEIDGMVVLARQATAAMVAGDDTRFDDVAETLDDTTERADQALTAFGLHECGDDGSTAQA